MKMLIVGAKGQMGQLLCRLLAPAFEVIEFDQADWENPQDKIDAADCVCLAVSMHHTLDVIEKIAPLLNEQQGLWDITSIKQPILTEMMNQHAGPVLGSHPIFGPGIQDNHLPWVFCEGRFNDFFAPLVTHIESLGFDVVSMSAAKHDDAMDIIQGVNYAVLRAYVDTVSEDEWRSSAMVDVIEHFLSEDPKLYDSIIHATDERMAKIRAFAESSLVEIQSSSLCGGRNSQFERSETTGSDGGRRWQPLESSKEGEPTLNSLILLESQFWNIDRPILDRLASPNFKKKLEILDRLNVENVKLSDSLGLQNILTKLCKS